jgi:hypothetical protein
MMIACSLRRDGVTLTELQLDRRILAIDAALVAIYRPSVLLISANIHRGQATRWSAAPRARAPGKARQIRVNHDYDHRGAVASRTEAEGRPSLLVLVSHTMTAPPVTVTPHWGGRSRDIKKE